MRPAHFISLIFPVIQFAHPLHLLPCFYCRTKFKRSYKVQSRLSTVSPPLLWPSTFWKSTDSIFRKIYNTVCRPKIDRFSLKNLLILGSHTVARHRRKNFGEGFQNYFKKLMAWFLNGFYSFQYLHNEKKPSTGEKFGNPFFL